MIVYKGISSQCFVEVSRNVLISGYTHFYPVYGRALRYDPELMCSYSTNVLLKFSYSTVINIISLNL